MRKSCIVLFITLLFWHMSAQGQEKDSKDSTLDTVIGEIALDVSTLRGLEFKTPVRHGIKTKDELRKYLQKLIKEEIPDEKLIAYQKALIKFGFIPADLPLESLLLELYTEQVAGFYDWRTKTLYLIDGIPETLLKALISHELTHALQDQHVGIENLPTSRKKEDDDRIMATQALLEGDAISLTIDYALKFAGKDSTMLPDHNLPLEEFISTVGGKLMASAPAYIRYNMLFPYIHGLTFVKQLRQSGGWTQVDRTLEQPPMSTEQILHPEKYLEALDLPTAITLPHLSKELGPGWTFLDKNTLGEFNINILLNEFLGEAPKAAAMGWDGDLYQIYEQKPSGKTALIWFTTWDSDTDAQEFFEGYSAVLTKKYGSETIGLRPHPLLFPTQEDDAHTYMELRGRDVLVLDGVPGASIDPVRASAWRATKVERP
ncbi:MAG: hypothetical protein ACE5IC_03285 [Candidatus Brocadiales bacterium]